MLLANQDTELTQNHTRSNILFGAEGPLAARSGESARRAAAPMQTITVVVPYGVPPGGYFTTTINGSPMTLQCPPGVGPGMPLQVSVPTPAYAVPAAAPPMAAVGGPTSSSWVSSTLLGFALGLCCAGQHHEREEGCCCCCRGCGCCCPEEGEYRNF